jgi:hypothetical protein
VGYTEEGSTFTYTNTRTPIEVAEEFDPIRYMTTARAAKLEVQLAEVTRQNLLLALGGGTTDVNDGTPVDIPNPGEEVAVMLLWDFMPNDDLPDEDNIRWIYRQCVPSGDLAIAHSKAPAKALIPVTFNLEKPAAGGDIVVPMGNSSGLVA